jgi:hypothetical protein
VKRRGFHTAHIWACPPYKGDDYILHCHPVDQKVPREDRLRKWYYTMLETAQEEGVVHTITTLYDENFRDPNNDATVLPYMEGDYWIGEVENLIKEIEDEEKEEAEEGATGASSKKRRGQVCVCVCVCMCVCACMLDVYLCLCVCLSSSYSLILSLSHLLTYINPHTHTHTHTHTQKKKGNKRTVRQRLTDGSGKDISRDPVMERLGEIINQVCVCVCVCVCKYV